MRFRWLVGFTVSGTERLRWGFGCEEDYILALFCKCIFVWMDAGDEQGCRVGLEGYFHSRESLGMSDSRGEASSNGGPSGTSLEWCRERARSGEPGARAVASDRRRFHGGTGERY